MTSTHKRRLGYIIFFVICIASITALVLFALQQNINFFYSPKQITAGEAPVEKRIRVGGMVKKGSLQHGRDLQINFTITDFSEDLAVEYNGILPDLFSEGQGVVALGSLKGVNFIADEILAKHDEKYMPPEVVSSINLSSEQIALEQEKF